MDWREERPAAPGTTAYGSAETGEACVCESFGATWCVGLSSAIASGLLDYQKTKSQRQADRQQPPLSHLELLQI